MCACVRACAGPLGPTKTLDSRVCAHVCHLNTTVSTVTVFQCLCWDCVVTDKDTDDVSLSM